MIKEIINNDFSEVAASKAAVVDFNATWCGPCKMMAPVLEKVSDLMEGKAEFFAIDVDENMMLAAQFGIQSIPTLAIFKDGELVAKSIGFVPQPALEKWLGENL